MKKTIARDSNGSHSKSSSNTCTSYSDQTECAQNLKNVFKVPDLNDEKVKESLSQFVLTLQELAKTKIDRTTIGRLLESHSYIVSFCITGICRDREQKLQLNVQLIQSQIVPLQAELAKLGYYSGLSYDQRIIEVVMQPIPGFSLGKLLKRKKILSFAPTFYSVRVTVNFKL